MLIFFFSHMEEIQILENKNTISDHKLAIENMRSLLLMFEVILAFHGEQINGFMVIIKHLLSEINLHNDILVYIKVKLNVFSKLVEK